MDILNKRHIIPLIAVAVLLLAAGCSTEKNTSQSRWWHSFNAKYNTYYNGSLAYIDGSLEKETGNKDNFTEMIPLYTVGNKTSKELGKAKYDVAIEKCQKAIKLHSIKRRPEWTKNRQKTERDVEWLNRKEYNPFLWKAWMLMGRSQFMKGAFDEAASTFAYMSRMYATQPAIYGRARAWLAKCYIEQDWVYDAEDVISKMRRDSMHWRAQKEWDYTYADYYIHTQRYEEAIPYLRKVIRHEMRRKQKARQWFLMGQMEAALGHKEKAYQAYKHVVRLNPPYELEFNARIAMTEVMAGGQAKKMVRRLKRMAASDNNKDYLDQVYYAIGNIYMNQQDTLKAIAAYEKGNTQSTRNGIEKGVLLLRLGDIYWTMERFSDAGRCYGEAIGLLDKERDDYKQLSQRSKVLDELVPYTEAIHLQDSLQALAKMPEAERNAAIDRVIEALKKKEKAERDAQAETNAEQQQAAQGGNTNTQNKPNNTQNNTTSKQGLWYFYNPMAVSQGKEAFQKQWGKRENVDDWQRVNKTVVAMDNGEMELTDEQRDSITALEAQEDSVKNSLKDPKNDPHKREYYMEQIPFTEDKVAESNNIIKDGLFNAGVIFKDKLDNLLLSEKHLRRLTDSFPEYEKNDEAFYHLYLLYSRRNDKDRATQFLDKLKTDYPESQWTVLLSDPYYEENARIGVHLEDSLYAATYAAFKADRLDEVKGNTEISASRFPLGDNRDKFIFIGGLSKLNAGDASGCLADMEDMVKKFPKSRLAEMAGMIINGVKAGRKLHGGKFDIGDVWAQRSVVMSDSDSIAARRFLAERDVNFSFVVAYHPDSLQENRLLFELARFNFTNFIVRNFDIVIDELNGLHLMKVSGFRNYDEALQYARQLYANAAVSTLTHKGRALVISDSNLELLGTQYSFNDYDKFYDEHFMPLRISTVRLLMEPESIEYQPQEEKTPAEDGSGTDDGNGINENDLFNGGVIEDGFFIDGGNDNPAGNAPADDNTIAVPEERPAANNAPADDSTIAIPEERPAANNAPAEDNTIAIPEERPAATPPTANDDDVIIIPQEEKSAGNQTDDVIIDFGDTPTEEDPQSGKQKKDAYELEDEYYDLDGF
ncbi:MAG: hypothetical protein PUD35_00395 [Bacteroidales bacterium]|nr:hypothetical protein [Bacteroidales bacterium]